MGVKNLWKIIKPFGKQQLPNNKKLAIDTSIWMYQLPTRKKSRLVYAISKRIFKILYSNITPVFVFDGNIPECKRKTVELRRKIALIKKRKDYIKQGRCMECHMLLKDCGHENKINLEKINELDNDVIDRIKSHTFNWGEFSDEIEYSSDEKETISDVINYSAKHTDKILKENTTQLNPILNYDFENFNKLTKDEKLQDLLYLRKKRGMPMEYDVKSADGFSDSQIRNLVKRNKINFLMQSLNENNKRIKSDWEMQIEYKNTNISNKKMNYNNESKLDLKENKSADEKIYNEIDEFMTYKIENKTINFKSEFHNLFEKYKDVISKAKKKNCKEDDTNWELVGTSKQEGAFKKIKNNLKNINQVDADKFINEEKDIEVLDEIIDDMVIEKNDRNAIQFEYINDYNENSKYNKKVKNIIIEVLDAFNIEYIESAFEADSQCAYLNIKGIVDGVISEDNDILVYKANIYRNFFSKNKDIELYEYNEIEKVFGFKDNDIVKLSYLLGSDYTPGVYGIGIKKAFEKIKDISDEDIKDIINIYKFVHVKDIDELKNKLIDTDKLRKILVKYALPFEQIQEIDFFCEKYNKNL